MAHANPSECPCHADCQPLPAGCSAQGASAAALHMLRELPQPLLPHHTASRLTTAAQELHLRPGVPAVAYYVAKSALDDLKPGSAGVATGAAGAFDVHALLKGIVKVLAELVEHCKARLQKLLPLLNLLAILPQWVPRPRTRACNAKPKCKRTIALRHGLKHRGVSRSSRWCPEFPYEFALHAAMASQPACIRPDVQENGPTVAELARHVGAAATQTAVGEVPRKGARCGFDAAESMAFLIRGYGHIFGAQPVPPAPALRHAAAARRSSGPGNRNKADGGVAPQRLDNLLTSVHTAEAGAARARGRGASGARRGASLQRGVSPQVHSWARATSVCPYSEACT